MTEDQLIVEVMTDKAAVEVPAPVSGRVISITGAPGDKVAVGSPLIVFELDGGAAGEAGGAVNATSAAPSAGQTHSAVSSIAAKMAAVSAPVAVAGTAADAGAARAASPSTRPGGSWHRRRIGDERGKPVSI